MKLLNSVIFSLFLVTGLFAQKASVTAEAKFFTDDPPKVDKLPLPSYPEIARKAGLGGRVRVEITLDEKGNVISANDPDGLYPVCTSVTDLKVLALRNSALAAAKRSHFGRRQVQVTSGYITYIFASEGLVIGDSGNERPPDRLTVVGNTDSDTGAKVESGVGRVVDSGGTGPPKKVVPKNVLGGVLNGKATSLPKPAYPPAARAVRAGGQVVVRVLITEEGNIYSAEAINGHPLLRRASEVAACEASFTPTLLSGKPVKVSGVITYNYVP